MMPSIYSSQGSIDDSLELVRNLGIRSLTLAIGDIMKTYEQTLAPAFQNRPADVTEENIQSRIRGNLLMRFPINSDLCCSPPVTSRKWQSATAHSTAT